MFGAIPAFASHRQASRLLSLEMPSSSVSTTRLIEHSVLDPPHTAIPMAVKSN
jgi:hypothetical protein